MIALRDVTESDLDAFFEHQSDPEGAAMVGFASRDRQAHLEHWHRNLAREDNISRTVTVDDAVAGHVVSWESDGRRWVGYWIGREYWGRGIGTQALRLFLLEVTRRPLHANVAVHNIGSRRVLEKAGFRRLPNEPPTGHHEIEELLFRLD
jgi:RimJ/RimL family protein N-acetyltransferase